MAVALILSLVRAVLYGPVPMPCLAEAVTVVTEREVSHRKSADSLVGDRVLRTTASVRGLTRERAATEPSVQIEGVVTYVSRWAESDFFVQDASGGIYVSPADSAAPDMVPVSAGDRVEIIGHAGVGKFAPVIRVEHLRRVGEGDFPAPLRCEFADFEGGRLDSQWVEIEGVIRAMVDTSAEASRVILQTRGGRLGVLVNQAIVPEDGRRVGATVRVRGVVYTRHRRRQYISTWLASPTFDFLRVTEFGAGAIENQPPLAIDELLTFARRDVFADRVHVRGVVQYAALDEAGNATISIRDDSAPLRLRLRPVPRSKVELPPIGAVISAIGFPVAGTVTPELEDAVYTLRERGPPPQPRTFAMEELFDYRLDGELLRVRCRVISIAERAEGKDGPGFQLRLKASGTPLWAISRHPASEFDPETLAIGGIVDVTGIHTAAYRNPVLLDKLRVGQLQLLIREPGDIRLVSPGPYWTLRRQLDAVRYGGAVFVAILLGGTFVLLRRIRHQHRERLLASHALRAIHQERARMARELHDSLAQGMTGISMQIECARDALPGDAAAVEHHLKNAGSMVRQSLDDARRSIRDMRSSLLEDASLETAIKTSGRQLTQVAGIAFDVRSTGAKRPLAALTESNLFRIAQELITNIVRHTDAKQIRVGLEYADRSVTLQIWDDGRPLAQDDAEPPGDSAENSDDSAESPGGESLGAGMIGVHERVDQLDGRVSREPSAAGGSSTVVRIPV